MSSHFFLQTIDKQNLTKNGNQLTFISPNVDKVINPLNDIAMKINLLLFLFSFSLSVCGQEEYYERIIGEDTDFSQFNDVIQTPDGGYALLGTQNQGSKLKEVYLVKTDANGIEEWSKTYGQNDLQDEGHYLAITPDNQLLIVGFTNPFVINYALDFSNLSDSNELFFRKVDLSDGSELWYKTINDLMVSIACQFELNRDGSLINVIFSNHLYQFNFEGEKVGEVMFTNYARNYKEKSDGGYIEIDHIHQGTLYTSEYDESGHKTNTVLTPLDWMEEANYSFINKFAINNNGDLIIYIADFLISLSETYEINWYIEHNINSSQAEIKIDNNNQIYFFGKNLTNNLHVIHYSKVNEDGTSPLNYTAELGLSPYYLYDLKGRLNNDGSLSFVGVQRFENDETKKGAFIKIEEDSVLWHYHYGIDGYTNHNVGHEIAKIDDDHFLVINDHSSNGLSETQFLTIDRAGEVLQTTSINEQASGLEETNDGHFLSVFYDSSNNLSSLVKFTSDIDILWELPKNLSLERLTKESDGYLFTSHIEDTSTNLLNIAFTKINHEGILIDSTVTVTDLSISENNFDTWQAAYKKDDGHYLLFSKNGSVGITIMEFDEDYSFLGSFNYNIGHYHSQARFKIMEANTETITIIGRKVDSTNSHVPMRIVKLDAMGNLLQEFVDPVIYTDAITLDDDAGFVVYGSAGYGPYGGSTSYITKVNKDLELQWKQIIGEDLNTVIDLCDESVDTEEMAFVGLIVEHNSPKLYYINTDTSLVALELNELPFQNANIQLFPNPTQDNINIVFENEQVVNGNITITNTMGQTIKTIKAPIFPNATLEISVRDLADGVYIVNIGNGKEVISKQFVVQH